jgi:serine/threonine protein kinase
MQTKLFLSYSRGDAQWRDRFLRHLKTMVSLESLWVDKDSIAEGADWESQLNAAVPNTRCALLLLTPQYLAHGSFANDRELDLLMSARENGLNLLPVLVEPCAWEDRPALAKIELLRWQNSSKRIQTDAGLREVMRALSEAGENESEGSRDSAVDRAVMEVCEHVKKAFGVWGQITTPQREQLSDRTRSAVERAVGQATAAGSGSAPSFEKDPIHAGDFTVVYRAEVDGQRVAVKAMPTDAWRNRVRTALEHAKTTSRQLRDPAFIRVEYSIPDSEVHALVMEYVDWPTLESLVAKHGTLPPLKVAAILSQIARAQHEAHQKQLQIGALSPGGIYVSDANEVRLAPFRVEGQLARGLSMSTGQLMNWDVLSMLTPEIYAGRQPLTAEELGRHEQYYLALLGLELLNGRRPVNVTCFKDLDKKAQFFDDPRAFFTADQQAGWTAENPALSFVLSRMLARDPVQRLDDSDEASKELHRIAEGRLPNCVRRRLESDYRQIVSDSFTASFYDRLFGLRPDLRAKFKNQQSQVHALREAVRDLVEFRPEDCAARFLEHAESHRAKGITPEDIEAFRTAFVGEIIDKSAVLGGGVPPRVRADAWNAVLKLGLGMMQQGVAGGAGSAYV